MQTFAKLILVFGLSACAPMDDDFIVEGDDIEAGDDKDDSAKSVWYDQLNDLPRPALNNTAPAIRVLRGAKSFENFFGQAAPSDIDFSRQMVIYYSAGLKGSGGYHVDVTGVRLNAAGDGLTVRTLLTAPGGDCVVSKALTRPGVALKVEKRALSVAIKRYTRTIERVCNGAVCGAQAKDQITLGAQGAVLISESDEAWKPVLFTAPAGRAFDKDLVLELLHKSASTNVEVTDGKTWFDDATKVDADSDDYYKEQAVEHQQMREALEQHLTDIQVFDVGVKENGDGVNNIYILGKTKCGEIAGVFALAVRT